MSFIKPTYRRYTIYRYILYAFGYLTCRLNERHHANFIIEKSPSPSTRLYNFIKVFGDSRVKKRVSVRVLPSVMQIIRTENLGGTLGETLSREKFRQESWIGLYAWLPARLSPRLVFFTRIVLNEVPSVLTHLNLYIWIVAPCSFINHKYILSYVKQGV